MLALQKHCTRAARELLPSYNSFWLTNLDKFPAVVSRFKKIMANFQVTNSFFQQSIISTVLFAVATAVAAIQTKHKNKMLSLWEMIEKFLLLRESPSTTPPPNPDATPKSLPGSNSLPKTSTERWNQADLGYFNPHLDRADKKGEVISVGKNIYYQNVVLLVQCLQSW